MQSLLAEQPILLSIVLAMVASVLLFAWLQVGRRELAIAAAVCVLLIPAAFFVADRWITDREQIRQIILDTAAAIEANDVETAAAIIADDQYRSMAMAELPRYQFAEARMTGERGIEVHSSSFPITAEADINVRVKLAGKGFGELTVPRRLILGFEKFGNDWKVMDYQHLPVVGPADGYSNVMTR